MTDDWTPEWDQPEPCGAPHPDRPGLVCGLVNEHPAEGPHGAWWNPRGTRS